MYCNTINKPYTIVRNPITGHLYPRVSIDHSRSNDTENVKHIVKSFDDRYELALALPGFTKEDISVSMNHDHLIIASKISETGSSKNHPVSEWNLKAFEKKFHLSKDLDTDNIVASMEHGVLKITILKKEEQKPRSIEIKD